MINIISPVLLYKDKRPIVVVGLESGKVQAFYKRTGRGGLRDYGAQAGDWAPFNGLFLNGWLVKDLFNVEGDLHRFGTQENKDVSQWLGTLDLEPTQEAEVQQVNRLLLIHRAEGNPEIFPDYSDDQSEGIDGECVYYFPCAKDYSPMTKPDKIEEYRRKIIEAEFFVHADSHSGK